MSRSCENNGSASNATGLPDCANPPLESQNSVEETSIQDHSMEASTATPPIHHIPEETAGIASTMAREITQLGKPVPTADMLEHMNLQWEDMAEATKYLYYRLVDAFRELWSLDVDRQLVMERVSACQTAMVDAKANASGGSDLALIRANLLICMETAEDVKRWVAEAKASR